jgi:hypothetical protein
MGSHDPFGHLKHKLWPKERLGVKLNVWLPATKSRESTRFPCVHVTCNMLLEKSWRGLQLWFRPHLNRRSAHKVTRRQSHGSPNVVNLTLTIWRRLLDHIITLREHPSKGGRRLDFKSMYDITKVLKRKVVIHYEIIIHFWFPKLIAKI